MVRNQGRYRGTPKKLLDILEKMHVPGKVLEDAIRVYGYADTGSYVDYI